MTNVLSKYNWRLMLASSGRYVAANVVVSALSFLRNILFIKGMGHGDLGQIAMLQTIVIAVGFLQFGLINGGYRLYASAEAALTQRINNNVFAGILTIGCFVIPCAILVENSGLASFFSIDNQTLLLGPVAGVATLASTWVNNTLVAGGRLGLSNAINLVAAFVSLLIVWLSSGMELKIALLAILAQPAIVAVLALLFSPGLRPRLELDREILRSILKMGFFPFCAGVVALLNFQIERWFIAAQLGASALGVYYLTIVYSTAFTIIPVSLLNLFYPRAVRAYEGHNKAAFSSITRSHLVVLCLYIFFVVLATVLFLPMVLENYLTTYEGSELLVLLSVPGLIALTLFDNIALILQSIRRMLSLFLFGLIALLVNLVLLSLAANLGELTLQSAVVIKSFSYIVAAVLIACDLYYRRNTTFVWK